MAAKTGYVPDITFRPAEDLVDVGSLVTSPEQEVWLLQLPHDFKPEAPVKWTLSSRNGDTVEATASVSGRTYVMESDLEAPPTFVPPAKKAGKSVAVSRVLVVRRAARSEDEICGAGPASQAEDKPESPRKEHKRARKEEKSHKKEKKEKKEKRSKDRK